MNFKSDVLIESKSLRESVIDRVDVLDKIKKLEMLPGDVNSSMELTADYYEVNKQTINSLIHDNREELESDGLRLLKGRELNSLKELGVIGKNTSSFIIIPRRAVLRIGMLLRDSLVARAVRDYLLNKEETRVQPSFDIKLLTPEMQMFKYLFDGVAHAQLENAEMKRQLADNTEKMNKVESTVTAIQDTMLTRDEDWRKSINSMLNAAAFRMGGKYQDLRNESYIMLEKRGKCNLKNRLSRLQKRLLENGSTKTKINGTSRMDVIESDPKLKEIYTSIVKELSIGSLKIVGG